MSECVCCGATVPEGHMICLICEKGKEMKIVKKKKLAYVAEPYRSNEENSTERSVEIKGYTHQQWLGKVSKNR